MTFRHLLLVTGAAATGLVAVAAKAQTADLVGARASSGEMALEERGYTAITGHSDGSGVTTYWWNSRSDECVAVQTYNGVYRSIYQTSHRDCGRHDGKGNAAAGLAVGALLVGLAATAHKSHHHDNDRHYDDWRREEAFERGYREGHSNSKHHTWDSYHRGYSDAQRVHYNDYNSGYGAGQRDSWRNVQIKDSSSPDDQY